MRISESAQCALGICASIAMLVGCANGGSQLASAGPMEQNVVRSANLRPAGRIGDEWLTAQKGGGTCNGFTETGTVAGPYPGTFTASGHWRYQFVGMRDYLTLFTEGFTITSGARTITGSFTFSGGTVEADCNSIVMSNDFTYTATLMRGKNMKKQFAGSAFETGINLNRNQFDEALY